MWRDIKKILYHKNNFLLTTHVNPDGDGIGAACAMIELLLKLEKKVRFICDSPIPSKFGFLDYHHLFESYQEGHDYNEFEVVIILDTHKKERIGRLSQIIDSPKVTSICIDHHPAPDPVFTPYHHIDSKACCVGAMIYTLYKECGFELDFNAACGIYASVLCDTGRFCYSSTSRKAHKIADECIKVGVDPDLMYSRLFQSVTLAEVRMFANALQHMETHLNNKVILQEIRREDYEKLGSEHIDIEHADLEYFLEFNKLVEEVECVVLLREVADDQIRVSIRTKFLDISDLVQALGGGGHSHAAGLNWNGTLHEIKDKILYHLSQLFEKKKASLIEIKEQVPF